ncbi:MAG TPA: NAD(P)-dependent oxidoreductase [Polyangia bacterium]|nr:NAD(P)-dependent oxidoreductase [Polyangia bacterium]
MTGAAGEVAGHLRRELAGRYRLRLSDRRPVSDLARGETFVRADLTRLAEAVRIAQGVDAIVHLGGFAVEGPWGAILEANIVGGYNVYEAARRAGVRRFVFASSNHAMGFHRRDHVISEHADVRPDGRYGVSKVFGEALGRLYADKYELQVLCLRIGNVNSVPIDERRLAIWLSPRDLAQLVTLGVEHPDIRFEIVYGVSGNRRSWYDNSNATRLGYRPQDDSERFAADVLARARPSNPVAALYQGGDFTVIEQVINPVGPVRPGRQRRRAVGPPVAKRGARR